MRKQGTDTFGPLFEFLPQLIISRRLTVELLGAPLIWPRVQL